MTRLKLRCARSLRSSRCMAAPKASQARQQGAAARTKSPPRLSAWPSAPPDPAGTYLTALAQTSQDLGLTH